MSTRGVGSQERGRQRHEALLGDAEKLLIEEGYAALSMRRLSERAGISLGNLQHYFPTKAALVEALLERVEVRLRQAFSLQSSDGQTARDALVAAVDALVENVTGERGFVPMWELWSLASHDADTADVMERAYARLMTELEGLIGASVPGLAANERASRALLLVGMVEGVGYLVAPGSPRRSRLPEIESRLRHHMLAIALESPSTA